jgi:L-aspartate oxidase
MSTVEPHSTPTFPRTLSGFELRGTPVLRTDVLVVGGGIAGATAALAASAAGASVLLLSKTPLQDTNTGQAQGGLAAVTAAEDSYALHLQDPLRVGGGLADAKVAESIISRAPDVLGWLMELGAKFDRDEAGNLVLSREGGHSVKRVVHANGDATGAEMQRVLGTSVQSDPGIDLKVGGFVRDLLVSDGRCVGVVAEMEEMVVAIEAGATILATGGAGQAYRETTNPVGACGDGVALAFRAGARLSDMEFVQFHPTTLYIAGAARFLISEIVRGAGATLRDRNGVAFMKKVHSAAELAPRDVVSRAILDRMVATGDTHVYLDMSTVKGDPHQMFPSISRICRAFDIDIKTDPVPVRPGAHYFVGGVVTDLEGRSSLPSLLVAGESACTRLHGANRLASNSLLEGGVLGRAAGLAAAKDALTNDPVSLPRSIPGLREVANHPRIHLDDMLYSMKSLMWRQVGLKRSAKDLSDALHRIAFWNHYLLRYRPHTRHGFELANMLTVSALVARAAMAREESRGTHYRTDHPERDDARWCRHLFLEMETDGTIGLEEGEVLTPSDTAPV